MIETRIYNDYLAHKVEVKFFTYLANFPIGTFVGAATINVNIAVQNDSDFLIKAIALTAFNAGNVFNPTPDYLLSLTDLGSGRQLQDVPVHVMTTAGTAQWPFRLPEPHILKGGSTLQVTLQNLTAIAARVDIAFLGFKIYTLQAYTR